MDYGSKTLGISVSDTSLLIATGITTIRYEDEEELFDKTKRILEEYKPTKIVLGNPINLDGSESTRSELTKEFRNKLITEFNIPVVLQDERLSTVSVHKMLIDNNTKRQKRKAVVDKIAATIILQSYLDKERNEKKQYNNIS